MLVPKLLLSQLIMNFNQRQEVGASTPNETGVTHCNTARDLKLRG